MTLQIKLAWRNIFRNKRRTIIAGVAIGVGLASMILTDALVVGMRENMIHAATASFLGEGQIHHDQFRETLEIEHTINDLDATLARLDSDPLVKDYSPRLMSLAMISSPANVSAVTMFGIDPAREQHLSQIDEAVVEGAYFGGDNARDIVIGTELAEILEVELGDRIVMTAAQAHSGDLAQEMFRVSGIYHFNIQEMDKAMAFVRLDKAREMVALPGQAHQIAMIFTDLGIGQDRNHPLWDRHSAGSNEAVGWTVLMPQLRAALEMSQFSTYLVGLILFSVVALGIINTLFMSLHERMFEFGVMRAVGTSPFSIGRLIIFEAGSLAVISVVLGSALGAIVTGILASTGIDYSGIEYAGVTFRELLYPQLHVWQFIEYPFLVLLFTTIIGLYPAIYAARMTPAGALRRSA